MLSLCMIAKNEGLLLEQCLSSVKDLVSEIIVVLDTSSSDATKDIAERFGAKVIVRPWSHDFSAARNVALSHATKPWILVLDGDEVLDPNDHDVIRKLLLDEKFQGYSLQQRTYTNDTSLEGFFPCKDDLLHKSFAGFVSCNIVRLFRNDVSFRFVGPVHEYVEDAVLAKGAVGVTSLMIHHYQELKGFDVFRQKQIEYLRLYEENIVLYPNQARAYRHMGNICYTFTKNYDKAIQYFKKSLELKPDERSYLGLGWCYIALDDFVHAEEAFKQGLEVNRTNQTLWISRGKLYVLMRKPKAAITCFENALKLGPNAAVQEMLHRLQQV
ncbi:MAG: glycosyltransferase [Nanoarchaeota archaeon]|nr:glycosyltransferase [Nanoarchaeota archaeon]